MIAAGRPFGTAERRLFPEGRLAGPMPWVIAIMMFLTVLAAAAGLGLNQAAARLGDQIGNRVTVQIVEANAERRDAQAEAALAALRGLDGVERAERVSDEEIARLLEPWVGQIGQDSEIPVPALIDVDLQGAAQDRIEALRSALSGPAPAARVDDNAQWLVPLAGLIGALRWLAAGLVAVMIGATAAVVVLAARSALNTHQATIEILHLMGATDIQIARMFQRRIAMDALFGGLVGFLAATAVLLLLGDKVAAIGSELLGSAALPWVAWGVLVALPLAGAALALLVARVTILRALGRLL